MELSIIKVKELDPKKILEEILPIIKSIYVSYEFIGLSEQDFKEIVLKEIKESKITYLGDYPYSIFIKKRVKVKLSEIIKKLLNDSEASYTLLDNFINRNFTIISTYEDALNCFKKLSSFLKQFDNALNPKVY